MRVVTTANKAGLEQYGQRWLDSRNNWPADAEFRWYTEGYELPHQPDELQMIEQAGAGNTTGWIVRKDFAALDEFMAWKAKHQGYVPPNWEFNVVGYAHKVFAAIDALYDYDGIGVWLDADCVTYRKVPAELIEKQVEGAYLACYQRNGYHTETGFWVMDCAHPEHRAFLDAWKAWYLTNSYKQLSAWHDCQTLDATIRHFGERIKVRNLSGDWANDMHPMAKTELGQWIDHAKGARKIKGVSPENKFREPA
jgi:hypothetical protein